MKCADVGIQQGDLFQVDQSARKYFMYFLLKMIVVKGGCKLKHLKFGVDAVTCKSAQGNIQPVQ